MTNIRGLSDHLCECGCGKFTNLWKNGNASRFINGHQCYLGARYRIKKIKKINDVILVESDTSLHQIKKKAVYEKYGGRCAICSCDDQLLHIHHVLPQSEGGSDELINLLLLCPTCHVNQHRSDYIVEMDVLLEKRLMRYNNDQCQNDSSLI